MGNPDEHQAGDDSHTSDDDRAEVTLRADWGTNDVLHGSGAPRSATRGQRGKFGGGR